MANSVWDTLFDDKQEVLNLKIRSELMATIAQYIRDNQLTQTNAAESFGISQPRVSDIIQGKIDKFSIDSLVNILGKVDIEMEVSIRNNTTSQSKQQVRTIEDHPWGGHEIFFKDGSRKRVTTINSDWTVEVEMPDQIMQSIG